MTKCLHINEVMASHAPVRHGCREEEVKQGEQLSIPGPEITAEDGTRRIARARV